MDPPCCHRLTTEEDLTPSSGRSSPLVYYARISSLKKTEMLMGIVFGLMSDMWNGYGCTDSMVESS